MPLIKIAGDNARSGQKLWRTMRPVLGYTAVGVPVAMIMAKKMHSAMTDSEPQQDIHAALADINNRKDRMQAVRTAFEDRFKVLNLPVVDDSKTTVKASRSMFPWKDNYYVAVKLSDHGGEPISDWDEYTASLKKDKTGGYTGNVDLVFTREDMQGKGVGRATENRMVQAFKDLGASKSRLMPAFDGPLVWAKKDFGYRVAPESKATFLKAYRKWTKEQRIPFEDLGDAPANYPSEFLKVLRENEPTWGSTHYEKTI